MSDYTLSKMNRMLSSIWGRIEERRDAKKIPKYKSWSSQVEKKASSLSSQLKYLESIDQERKDKLANVTQKLITIAEDMNSLLMVTQFKDDNNNGTLNSNGASQSHDSIRMLMLDLWATLLAVLKSVEGDTQAILQETVMLLMRRQEFEVDQLVGAAASTESALRYRDMLYSTLDTVSPRTSEGLGLGLSFASRVLAVLHWRLPQVGAAIITSVSRDLVNADQELLVDVIPLSNDSTQIDSPTLLAWPSFHKSLSTDLTLQNYVWADNLAKREFAFVVFFKEWILYVKSVLKPGPSFDWYTVPGYHTLVATVLHDIRTKEQPPAPISRPYPLLELQYLLLEESRGMLITPFVRAIFLRTSAYDLLIVMNTLSLLEGWFGEIQRKCSLPDDFDITFFCKGLNILLDSDHHQIVLRVLQVIYNSADIFNGSFRYLVFGELLLQKMFFTLFLHWDPGVRNAFQQLLIFKMVRIKRSELCQDGYVVRELSKIQPKKMPPPPETSSPSSPLAVITRTISHFAHFPSSDHGSSTSSSQQTHSPEKSPSPDKTQTETETQTQGQAQTPPSTTPTRVSPEKAQMSVDAQLFLMLNEHLMHVEEQMRANDVQKYPAGLQVYVPAALAGFNGHLARYHQWELKNEDEVPRLAPLPFVRLEGSG